MTRIGETSGILKPSVPYVELVGAALVNAILADWNELRWTNVEFQTSDFESRPTSGADANQYIYVYTTGLYEIECDLGLEFSGTDANIKIELRILKNGVEISGSRSIGMTASTTDYLQLSSSRTTYLKFGDEISFQFYSSSDDKPEIADTSTVFYCRARIIYVPLGGFNNNAGGKIIYRGVRR